MSEDAMIVKKIGLAKLYLWMEAARIESYPEAFALMKADTIYTKKTLALDALGLLPLETGKFVREDFLNNMFGLAKMNNEKVSIRGINALREVAPGQYEVDPLALEIGQAYRQKDKDAWLSGFTKMIACFEVRTRVLLYLLGKGGCELVFPEGDFFGPRAVRGVLVTPYQKIAIFMDNHKKFNELLQEYRWVALGPWWEKEITALGMGIAEDFRFEGLREKDPPTNVLSTRLKVSLFLMKHQGIIESQQGGWVVNPVRATSILGEEIAQDFVKVEFDRSPIQHLQDWQSNLQDELGYVVVSELVQRWKEYKSISINEAEIEFDNWIRQQIYHGRIRILETHAGQPRLGRGLNGVETARKIRFEIMEA